MLPSASSSHVRSWHAWLVTQPATASWALSPPLNLSLKTPPRCSRFPTPGDTSLPPPHFPRHPPPAPQPGQDVPTWPRVPRAGWERPRSHGTDPLRMLQPGHPQPLINRASARPPRAHHKPDPRTTVASFPLPTQAGSHRDGFGGSVPPSPQEGGFGAVRVGEAAQGGAETGRGEGRDGEQVVGRSPISATSARQPGHSHDFILIFFCFLSAFSTGPFRINYKSVTGRNHKPSPRGSCHGPGLTPHSPCHRTAAVLGRQAGGCGDRDKHGGMSPCARPGDDTTSLSHITPSPPTTGQMTNKSHLPRWIQT